MVLCGGPDVRGAGISEAVFCRILEIAQPSRLNTFTRRMLLQGSNLPSPVSYLVELSFRGTECYEEIVPQWGHLTENEFSLFLPLFQLAGLLSSLLSKPA